MTNGHGSTPGEADGTGVLTRKDGNLGTGSSARMTGSFSMAGAYDELDHERDELGLEQEGIDDMEDFLKDVQASVRDGGDKSRIKTLEKSLEGEKRRLAGMEMQLREAKRQRDAETQMVVVTKQSKMLETMMEAMSKAAMKETGDRQHWEKEWQERFGDFHGQHSEMEDALKRKHVQELKSIKEDIQRNIRRVANEVQRTKGKSMPSPRTMGQMQEDNMGRILLLFHKHGQERLTLASKVAKQEEMLVHTKNQSLQKMMGQSQVKSNKLYTKVLPAVKTGKRFDFDDDAEIGAGGSAHNSATRHDSSHAPAATRGQSRQRSRTAGGGAGHDRMAMSSSWSSRSAAPLPSPRIDYNNVTFLTGIEDEYESNENQGKYTRPSKVVSGGGGSQMEMGSNHGGMGHSLAPSAPGGNAASLLGGEPPNIHVGPKSYFQNPDNAQFAKGISDPSSYRGGGPAHLTGVAQSGYMTNNNVGQEFGGWAPPAPPTEQGRPDWNEGGMTHGLPQQGAVTSSLTNQWHPNIIAFDKSTTGYGQQTKKTSSASPYLSAQPLSKKAKAGTVSARGAGSQRSQSVTSMSGNGKNSGRSQSLPPAHAAQKRSTSTEPGHSTGGSGRFPKIADSVRQQPTRDSARQQPTDQNTNRPHTHLGQNDDFSLTQSEKIGKLETWIEDKIKGVLGNSATRDNILTRGSTAASFGERGAPSRGTDYASRAPTVDMYPHSDDGGTTDDDRRQPMPSSTGGVSRTASTRGDVSGLMSKLKTRLEDNPTIAKSMELNTGFGVETRDDKIHRLREYETSRKGVPIDQTFEGQDIDNTGRFDRDGRRVEMTASENVDERRNVFDSLQDDRTKTPKYISPKVGFIISFIRRLTESWLRCAIFPNDHIKQIFSFQN